MKYYVLYPKDLAFRSPVMMLYRYDPETERREVREPYRALACPVCRKMDEWAALRSGIDPDFCLRSRVDFVGTDDDQICISARLKDILLGHGVGGIDLIPLANRQFYAVVPSMVVRVDRAASAMRFFPPCRQCGRPNEVSRLPEPVSIRFPDQENVIFSTELSPESIWCRSTQLYTSEAVVRLLKKAKVTGIEPDEL